MSENIPLKKQHLEEIFNETGFNSENLSIRETNRLATIINEKHNIEFVRMEMGIPNIPTPNIAKIADLDVVKIIIAINVDTIKKLINLRKIFLWLLNKNPRQRGNIIHNQAPA